MSPLPARAQSAIKLDHAASTTWFGHVPLMVAIDRGYFKDLGLDVELKPIVKSSDRMLALTQGAVQWTNTGVLSVIVEMAKGNESFYWFANVDDSPGAEGLVVQPGINGVKDLNPGQLSGGMQQRVTLARLLAADSEVFLMDEPFAALDAMTRQVMQEELIRIHEQSRKTTVFVTHNIDEALILADRVVVMSARPGRVRASIANDLPRPRHVDVQLSPRYLELKRQIWGHVEEEVRRHIEATPHAERER